MHFLALRKKLVSYFASVIKRDVTIIINYENMLQLMTTLFLSKLMVTGLGEVNQLTSATNVLLINAE